MIFQASLDSGQVPLDWRKAKVVPIFKKGSKGDAGNYRPVSLTSTVCKLLESILREKVTSHLIDNAILEQSQHGFLSGRSCQTNLLEFIDAITALVDKGDAIDVIYLDFSKAFDKVNHSKLIQKLEAHGIKGQVKTWIQEWLKNRKQWVEVDGEQSEEADVGSGVPQGSVLGPLLFLIYINDIDGAAMYLELLKKFADDTKLAKIIRSPEDAQKLQDCLDSLGRWGEKWNMDFNVKKCKVMHIGRSNPKHKYFMNGAELKEVDSEKDIGVCIAANLKPSQQCQEAANRARSVLGRISRCFHYRDKKVFLRLYKQYVRPHLEFSSSVWSPWTAADIALLESVQEKALRMMSGLMGKSYAEKLLELDLWTLEKRREKFDLVQCFKVVHGIGNVQTSLVMVGDTERASLVTRNQSDPLNLIKQRANLEVRRNFYTIRIVDKWNSLPAETKHSPNVETFKRRIVKIMN